MKIRFLLKTKTSSPTHPIFVALYDSDDVQLIYTGERISKSAWSKRERLPKDQTGSIYKSISQTRTDVDHIITQLQAKKETITALKVKSEYDNWKASSKLAQQRQGVADKMNATAVSKLVDRYLNEGLTEYRPSTRKAITESMHQFQSYIPSKLGRNELDRDTITKYSMYLEKIKKLRDSTHGKRMKHLKWFLQWMVSVYSEGKINSINQIKDIVKIRTIREGEQNKISLTQSELTQLEAVPVDNRDQERARDMFLLMCYTSLRISDAKRISQVNIVPVDAPWKEEIHMTLLKTSRDVKIPLLKPAKEILKKYEWRAPRITEQATNHYIKEVAAKAGLDRMIEYKSVQSRELKRENLPLHKLITCHIGGKTFISLTGVKWALTPMQVAGIVGKDIRTILKHYLNPDLEEAKKKIHAAEQKAARKARQGKEVVMKVVNGKS